MGRGSSRSTAAIGTSIDGTQTVVAFPASADATAAPTAAGVLDSGAGLIPSVIRPMTKPGLTSSTRTPLPCSESVRPRADAARPALAAPYTKVALQGRIAAIED